MKFRAWDVLGKNWCTDQVFLGSNGDPIAYGFTPMENMKGSVIVSQYTGCKDKYGKEIYEGDIVEVDTEEKDYDWLESLLSHKGVVKWVEGGCLYWVELLWPKNIKVSGGHEFLELRQEEWDGDENEIEGQDLIVVGNIYENPPAKEEIRSS